MSAKKQRPQQEAGSIEGRRKHQPTAAAAPPRRDRLLPLFGALFGLLLCFSSTDTIKGVALAAMLVCIAAMLFRSGTLRARITWPFLAVSALVLINGVSTLYAVAPKFALYEFLKIVLAYAVFIVILAFSRERGDRLGRTAASVLSAGAAFVSLLSIDLISTRLLSGAFSALMGLFGQNYANLSGVEPGVRMVSVFGNGNVFAGCTGIGVLLSLGLAATAEEKRDRRFHLCTLALNALGFVLAFSMGASGMIVLGFLAYLLLESPQRRVSSLVLMLETLVITLAATFPIYLTAFDGQDGFQPIPLLCAAVAAAALCLVDETLGRRLSAWYSGLGKSVFLPLAAIVGLLAVFAVLCATLTGPVSLQSGGTLRRAAYPSAGGYLLQTEADGTVNVTIESQNRQDAMMHTSTTLYSGSVDGAAFIVPEDSMVVYFSFSAPEGAELISADYSGAESGSLKLGYKLLPGFIANRLQGLRANQNAIQRIVFFEDGMKIFRMSPVVGRGLGAFENGCVGVQSFFYETKYVHNHYIQTLLDTGVIGALSFLSVLVLCAWAVLVCRRRGGSAPLTAALGAALVFMAGHAAVEVVFSASVYLPMAYGVFALISLCCAPALPSVPLKDAARNWVLRAAALLLTAYTVLLLGNLYARSLAARASYDSLAEAVKIDRFEWADYALSYVYNSGNESDPPAALTEQAEEFLPRLEKVDSNTIPIYLAEYYFKSGRTEDGFRMLEKYTAYVSAKSETWQQAFGIAMNFYDGSETYRSGVAALYQAMQDWNRANMGTLTLDDATAAFVDIALS